MKSNTSRPSLKQVAKHAGVSHQTVSRVINGESNVSLATKNKVQKSINKLGYVRNLSAKALASGKFNNLGILNLNSTLYGPTTLYTSVQKFAHEKHYNISSYHIENLSNSQIIDGVNYLHSKGVDGILVIVPRLKVEIDTKTFSHLKIPILIRDSSELPSYLKLNHRTISSIATTYLIDNGHTKIAFIGGPESWYDGIERLLGWKSTMKLNGLSTNRYVHGEWTAKSGYILARKVLEKYPDTTAVYSASDIIGLGVLKYLNENKKLKMAVISSDEMPESAYYFPSLTTVRYDYVELARRLCNATISLVQGKALDYYSGEIEVKLLVRDSTR